MLIIQYDRVILFLKETYPCSEKGKIDDLSTNYIDRTIFERLERYVEEIGQQMTTAIERILAT